MFPKRGTVALGLTGLALALLLSFKTPSEAAPVADTTGVDGGGVALADPSAADPSATTDAGSTGAPSTTAGPAATTTPRTTATPDTATAAASGTYAGAAVSTRWGNVQVQVTIENGQIVDVAALELPANDPRSSQLSQRAEPILRSSAIAAQSAVIDFVSGATYTSRAYAQSLQAALDQAGM